MTRQPAIPSVFTSLRLPAPLHAAIVKAAQKAGLPINTYLVQLLASNVKGA